MREVLVNKLMLGYEKNPKYDELMLAKIKYGAQCAYTLFTKLCGIFIIAASLNIVKYVLLFTIFYSPLRIFGFGFHAPSNIWCWILSLSSYLGFTLAALHIDITSIQTVFLIIAISIPSIIFSPSDTKKRPLINRKKAKFNKKIIAVVFLIYLLIILVFNNKIINNFIITASIWNLICVSPILYTLFNQPYNNYKKYKKNS